MLRFSYSGIVIIIVTIIIVTIISVRASFNVFSVKIPLQLTQTVSLTFLNYSLYYNYIAPALLFLF